MQEKEFRAKAIQAVVDYFNSQAESTDKSEGYVDAYKKWKNFVIK